MLHVYFRNVSLVESKIFFLFSFSFLNFNPNSYVTNITPKRLKSPS